MTLPIIKYVEKNDRGIVVREQWLRGGVCHREDGPADIAYYDNGKVCRQIWLIDGKRHRENAPAFIRYWEYVGRHEYWYCRGEIHRINGPAAICYGPDGTIETEHWLVEGKYYKENGPIFVRYGSNGMPIEARWHTKDSHDMQSYSFKTCWDNDGNMILIDFRLTGRNYPVEKPIMVHFYSNGCVLKEEWMAMMPGSLNFISHRENGPSIIHYDNIDSVQN